MAMKKHLRPSWQAALLGIAALALCAPVAGRAAETRLPPVPIGDGSGTTLDMINANGSACGRTPFAAPIDYAGPRCLFDNAALGFNFTSRQATDMGMFEAYATIAGSSGGALTPERMIAREASRLGDENRVVIAGLKASLLDDRVMLTTEMGWSEYFGAVMRTGSPERASFRSEPRDGTARRIKLDLTLVDTPRLRWTMTGEMSDVSDDFFMGQAAAMRRQIAFPGKRLALSSALKRGPARFTAHLDNHQSSFGTFTSGRLGVSYNGFSLRLKTSAGNVTPIAGSPLLAATSENRNLSLEVDFNTLSPSLASNTGLLAALVPDNLMLNWRAGESESVTVAAVNRYSRKSWEINGSWETPVGETSLGYWRDQKVGTTPELGVRGDESLQLSHMVRWNGWRAGVDGLMSSNFTRKDGGQSDRTFSLGGSIAYSKPNGPQLMIRMGRDESRGRSHDDSFRSSQDYSSIAASLDLTDYLRKRFERQDLRLKLEYRKRIEASNYTFADFDQSFEVWSDAYRREGLLVSFGMKL